MRPVQQISSKRQSTNRLQTLQRQLGSREACTIAHEDVEGGRSTGPTVRGCCEAKVLTVAPDLFADLSDGGEHALEHLTQHASN